MRLRDRLGEDFLKALPSTPGVYLLLGEGDELLYVGKAKNLRTRLRSYTRLTREADPRLVSLVAKVRTVRWESLASEADALARETQLLRALRPPFNRSQTTRTDHLGIAITEEPARVRLRMGANGPLAGESAYCCYPFEAGTPNAFIALVRVLVVAQPGVDRPSVPSRVTKAAGFEVAVDDELRAPLRSFVCGRSPSLLGKLARRIADHADPILVRSATKELDTLQAFYPAGPRHVRRLQLRYGAGDEVVDSEVLFRLMGSALLDEVGVTIADDNGTEETIATLKRDGLGFQAIADRLNRDAIPRLRGGGRWTAADIAEVVGQQISRDIAETARALR